MHDVPVKPGWTVSELICDGHWFRVRRYGSMWYAEIRDRGCIYVPLEHYPTVEEAIDACERFMRAQPDNDWLHEPEDEPDCAF